MTAGVQWSIAHCRFADTAQDTVQKMLGTD